MSRDTEHFDQLAADLDKINRNISKLQASIEDMESKANKLRQELTWENQRRASVAKQIKNYILATPDDAEISVSRETLLILARYGETTTSIRDYWTKEKLNG